MPKENLNIVDEEKHLRRDYSQHMGKNFIPIYRSCSCIMVGYYDLVLGVVPFTLLGVTGGLYGVGVDLTLAVPLAAAIAALVIGHGLFVNAPVATEAPPEPQHPAAD